MGKARKHRTCNQAKVHHRSNGNGPAQPVRSVADVSCAAMVSNRNVRRVFNRGLNACLS